MYVENVFNTTLIQYNGHYKINNQLQAILGLQGIYQQAINYGGNADPKKTYMDKNNKAYTYGARLGLQSEQFGSVQVNYNRITSDGRYLMPREWGRDPFFAFMPRERNEGYGDVHAINAVVSKTYKNSGIRTDLSYGQYYLPVVKNYSLNKYAMPSYWQLNADVRYLASGFFKGFELQFLYVYKGQTKTNYSNDKFVFNKADMGLYNLVINYHF